MQEAADLDIQPPAIVEIVKFNPHQFSLTSIALSLIIFEKSLFRYPDFRRADEGYLLLRLDCPDYLSPARFFP